MQHCIGPSLEASRQLLLELGGAFYCWEECVLPPDLAEQQLCQEELSTCSQPSSFTNLVSSTCYLGTPWELLWNHLGTPQRQFFFNLAIAWGLLRTTLGQPWDNLGTTCRLLDENVEAAFEQH